MTTVPVKIEHVVGESGHGPVAMFISDGGELVIVCERDQACWGISLNVLDEATPAAADAEALELRTADDVDLSQKAFQVALRHLG